MNGISHYELSLAADEDIEAIFDYTELHYGRDQAINYVLGFEQVFQKLIVNPELGKERPEIKTGLRSFPKDSHVIFYRIMEDSIRIVRVLHGRWDVLKFLE